MAVVDASGTIGGPTSLHDGLYAAFEFDNAEGDSALDSHEQNLHLTDNATVQRVAGLHGNAAFFEAANNEFFSSTDAALSLATIGPTYTFSFWIKGAGSATGTNQAITKWYSAVADREFRIQIQFIGGSGVRVGFFIAQNDTGSTGGINSPYGLFSATDWDFVVAWRDDAAASAYIQINNGTIYSASLSGGQNTSSVPPFAVGRHSYTGNADDVTMDNVWVWDRVLTDDERTELYNSGTGIAYLALSNATFSATVSVDHNASGAIAGTASVSATAKQTFQTSASAAGVGTVAAAASVSIDVGGSITNPITTLTNGLYAAWEFDSTPVGTDSHTKGIHLTDVNGVIRNSDTLVKKSVTFVASNNDYFESTDPQLSLANIGNNFTFSFWIKGAGTISGSNNWPINKSGPTVDGREFIFRIRLAFGSVRVEWTLYHNNAGGSDQLVPDGGLFSTTGWDLVTFWRDDVAGTMNIQINNGTVYSTAVTGPPNTSLSFPFAIGRLSYSANDDDIIMDSVWIWNRVLAANERTELFGVVPYPKANAGFSATTSVQASASGSISGSGTFAADPHRVAVIDGLVAGSGTVASTAKNTVNTVSGISAVAGSGTVTSTATRTLNVSSSVAGSATFSAAVDQQVNSEIVLSGTGASTGVSKLLIDSVASVSGIGAFSAQGAILVNLLGTIEADGTVVSATAGVTVLPSGTISGVGAFSGNVPAGSGQPGDGKTPMRNWFTKAGSTFVN